MAHPGGPDRFPGPGFSRGSDIGTQLQKLARQRWLTTLFAPDEVRPLLQAVYLLDATLDDVRLHVRTPMIGLIRLQWWREALETMRQGGEAAAQLRQPALEALAPLLQSNRICNDMAEPLIAAHEKYFSEDEADQALHPQAYGAAMAAAFCAALELPKAAHLAIAARCAAWRRRQLGIEEAPQGSALPGWDDIDREARKRVLPVRLLRLLPCRGLWEGLLPLALAGLNICVQVKDAVGKNNFIRRK